MKSVLFFLLLTITITAQNRIDTRNLFSAYATKANRTLEIKTLARYKQALLNYAPGKYTEKETLHQLKELSLALQRDDTTKRALLQLLKHYRQNTTDINCSAIESAKALFPNNFESVISEIMDSTTDKRVFSFAAIYLTEYPKNTKSESVLKKLRTKFPEYEKDEYLKLLAASMKSKKNFTKEEIIALLSAEYGWDKTVIFAIFRSNRIYPGISIIRKPDGRFVRDENGEVIAIPELSLGVANLPGFMRYGNTPEGIFSVQGFYVSPTESIGPTPNIITRIPFEKPPKEFFHGKNKFGQWNINDYSSLLPEELRNREELFEAFYAGKFGRRLLVMHGSTDDLSNYKSESYYPHSPTKGCISSIEIWDSTGKNFRSDQAKLINAYFSSGNLKGYLVVFDIDGKDKAVSLTELKDYIAEAEKILKKRSPLTKKKRAK